MVLMVQTVAQELQVHQEHLAQAVLQVRMVHQAHQEVMVQTVLQELAV